MTLVSLIRALAVLVAETRLYTKPLITFARPTTPRVTTRVTAGPTMITTELEPHPFGLWVNLSQHPPSDAVLVGDRVRRFPRLPHL